MTVEFPGGPEGDPDFTEALDALDREFPGTPFDASMPETAARNDRAELVKKRLPVILVKFSAVTVFLFLSASGSAFLSFPDYALILAGAAAFALIPAKTLFSQSG
jgi:hypothetical protein